MNEKQIYSKHWNFSEKNNCFLQKELFFATFVQQQSDNFFVRDPKRRLIQENQEKEYQAKQKTSKTWKRQGTRMTQ